MSEPAYSCRISLLKCFAKSPAHAKHFIDGGLNDESLSMRLGTAGHALLFGTPEVVIYKGGILREEKTKKGKKGEADTIEIMEKEYTDVRNGKLWDKFSADNAGKAIVNQTEYDKAAAMAKAVQCHPDADRILFSPGTVHEQLVEWMYGGRRCTGRLDSLGLAAIGDLKCMADVSPQRFPFVARKLGYAAQLAWYSDGVELAGMDQRPSYLIAVENSPPWNVQVYEMTPEDIDYGRAQYNAWFDRLLECEASGYWPGYADGILPLNVLGLPMPADDEEASDDAAA